MVCQICGGTVGRGQRFCATCGTRIALEPPPIGSGDYSRSGLSLSRVERHVQALGVLWAIYGVFRLVRGLIGILILRVFTLVSIANGGWPPDGIFPVPFPSWMNVLLPLFAAFTILGMLLSFGTAYALLTRRSWGRPLAITAAALAMIKFPVGTALGIYTLWVLAPAGSKVEHVAF